MKFDPQQHHRRSIRLKGYDYTQSGAYFVTLVTQGRQAVFGEVVNGQMCLNAIGKIVQREWESLPRRFPFIQLDAFVIMPNHVHAVIVIDPPAVGATHPCQPEIHSGQSQLPTHTTSGNDGSPRHRDDTQSLANDPRLPTGATRSGLIGIGPDRGELPDEAMVGDDALSVCYARSPLPANDSPAVGATHPYQPEIHSGQSHLPTHTTSGNDGSPLRHDDPCRPTGPTPASLGAIIGQFKSRITKQVWRAPSWKGVAIWQRNYFEHIIRNENEHQRITLYIEGNPECWPTDDENPGKTP